MRTNNMDEKEKKKFAKQVWINLKNGSTEDVAQGDTEKIKIIREELFSGNNYKIKTL